MTNSSSEAELDTFRKQSWFPPLYRHRLIVLSTYAATALGVIAVLDLKEAQENIITLLSVGAILTTFGSAVATLGTVWERDLLERIKLNIDILYKDIIRQDQPWRRWLFLPRSSNRKMLDGTTYIGRLSNPNIPLDVGTHIIHVSLPTVLDDFFDLSARQNFLKLARFRAAAGTTFSNRKDGEINPETRMDRGNQYMAYECLYDIWRSIVVFRLARYAIHLGASLTVAAACTTAVHVAFRMNA